MILGGVIEIVAFGALVVGLLMATWSWGVMRSAGLQVSLPVWGLVGGVALATVVLVWFACMAFR